MSNIFIIHGLKGYPEENWFPWLKEKLEEDGHKVIVPQFPTPLNQTTESWFETLKKYKEFLTPDCVMVGHSLGVPFILSVIEKYPIKAAFFVAGFTGKIGPLFDRLVENIAQRDFDWEKIKKNCHNFTVFHSDNDPFVKLEKAEELAKNLGVKVDLIKNAGHFRSLDGYKEFDLLLERIRGVLSV